MLGKSAASVKRAAANQPQMEAVFWRDLSKVVSIR
jgi:hypothetical protein